MDDDLEARAERMFADDRASRWLGMDVEVRRAGHAIARLTVSDDMTNGFGVCHGGIVFSLADTAFAFACNGGDNVTVAAAAGIDFLRPAYEGDRLTAEAKERHRGGRAGVYDVTVSNQDGEPIALFRGRAHATGRKHAKVIQK